MARRTLLFLFLLIGFGGSGCNIVQIHSIITPSLTLPSTPTKTLTPQLTPTETIVWFPPTDTPLPLNTPTVFPTVDMRPARDTLWFSDDFSSAENWDVFRTAEGGAIISNNLLTLTLQDAKSQIFSFSNFPPVSNGYMEMNVDVSLCTFPNDSYSIFFRTNREENIYYEWEINCRGETRVILVNRDRKTTIMDWSMNGLIRVGAPQKFSIGIHLNSEKVNLFINDQLLAELNDMRHMSGGFGLGLSSEGSYPITISFSDFRFYKTD